MQPPAATHLSHSANVTSRRPIAKSFLMRDFMNGRFGRLGVRAHLEFARRNDDKLDAIWAIAKRFAGQSGFAGLGGAG